MTRTNQFKQWDTLIESLGFGEYLLDRNLQLTTRALPLPHDDAAEQALLGALVYGDAEDWQERNPDVLSRVRPHHFYWGENGVLYLAVARVYARFKQARGGAPDAITVGSELRGAGFLVGDDVSIYDHSGVRRFIQRSYLSHIWDVCPNTANVRAYADTVLECARLRSLHGVGQALQSLIVGNMAPRGQHDFSFASGQPLGSDSRQIINALRKAADDIEHQNFADLNTLFENTK